MAALWREGQLCDVSLAAADGRCVRAHRVVLASASSYFRALLMGAGAQCAPPQLSEDGLPRYSFEHIDHAALLALLRVIYEGSAVELTGENAAALLYAANYLDIDVVREACCQACTCLNLEACLCVGCGYLLLAGTSTQCCLQSLLSCVLVLPLYATHHPSRG